jgi:hypothetical protein
LHGDSDHKPHEPQVFFFHHEAHEDHEESGDSCAAGVIKQNLILHAVPVFSEISSGLRIFAQEFQKY